MNVLLFVMSFLMLFSLLTYGRLESFRHFGFVQKQFESYMEKRERQYVNEAAIKRYKTTIATRREKDDEEKHETNLASSKLSFRILVDKKERDRSQNKIEPHRNLAKNLIEFLYGNQSFYKDLKEKRPGFVDDMLTAIMQKTASQEKTYTEIGELATIRLEDADLDKAFHDMLKGKERLKKSKRTSNENFAFQPDDGYYRLQDFITMDPKKDTIRVYLASGPLLTAIYGNPDTVREILNIRNQLYRTVYKKEATKAEKIKAVKEAGTQFADFCKRFSTTTTIPESMLDFTVSGSRPQDYE